MSPDTGFKGDINYLQFPDVMDGGPGSFIKNPRSSTRRLPDGPFMEQIKDRNVPTYAPRLYGSGVQHCSQHGWAIPPEYPTMADI